MADDAKLTPADPVGGEHDTPAPSVASGRSGKAIASLICGILSLLIAGVIFGAVAVVLGILARKEIAEKPAVGGAGMALAGIIIGVAGFVIYAVVLAFGIDGKVSI